MKKTASLLITVTLLLLTFVSSGQVNWKLDMAHSNLGFAIQHQLVNDVKGTVKVTQSTISQPKDDFTDATILLKADMNTIDTDEDKRDAHLKSADFFDAAKYPELIFQSTSFVKKGPDTYTITGNLTLHGIMRTVTLNVVAKTGKDVMTNKPVTGFKVTGVIKRTHFDISSSIPTEMISDEVSIEANLEFGKE